MNEKNLLRMESQIEQLIDQCLELQAENQQLKAQQEHWSVEKSNLAQKNEMARTRIERLISQLRQLEAQCGAEH